MFELVVAVLFLAAVGIAVVLISRALRPTTARSSNGSADLGMVGGGSDSGGECGDGGGGDCD